MPLTTPAVPTDSGKASEKASLLIIVGILVGVSALLALVGLLWPGSGLGGARAGCFGLAAVFLFTGMGHFARARGMAEMLPRWVPGRLPIVWATGVMELAFAVGLALPAWARTTGLAVIAFLVLVFPANVSAAARGVDFGGHGRGFSYLWIRAPLQLLLIAWAWWFAVR
jgi:uncharacterized membrane protein